MAGRGVRRVAEAHASEAAGHRVPEGLEDGGEQRVVLVAVAATPPVDHLADQAVDVEADLPAEVDVEVLVRDRPGVGRVQCSTSDGAAAVEADPGQVAIEGRGVQSGGRGSGSRPRSCPARSLDAAWRHPGGGASPSAKRQRVASWVKASPASMTAMTVRGRMASSGLASGSGNPSPYLAPVAGGDRGLRRGVRHPDGDPVHRERLARCRRRSPPHSGSERGRGPCASGRRC